MVTVKELNTLLGSRCREKVWWDRVALWPSLRAKRVVASSQGRESPERTNLKRLNCHKQ